MVPFWQFGLTGVLAVAVATDLHNRKIYNWLTFPAMAVGLLLSTAMGGLGGLESSLIGFFAGIVVFAIGFFLNAGYMGAGDVKLMGAIGLWLGWPSIIATVLYVTAVGGIMALLAAIYHGSLTRLFKNIYWALVGLAVGGNATIDAKDSAAPALPYGVSIVLGTLLAMLYPDPAALFHAVGVWK